MELHQSDRRHETYTEVALVRAFGVRGSDLGAAPGTAEMMKVVPCDFDFLWWREVFDDSGFDAGCGSQVGAAPGTAIHGHRDDLIRFRRGSGGAVMPGWGATFPWWINFVGVAFESLHRRWRVRILIRLEFVFKFRDSFLQPFYLLLELFNYLYGLRRPLLHPIHAE